ncbi:phage protein Gp27 family protein [uncultured Roseibium sp.]|uniref:phage protein Gp27 family protein n=1 Tax=uncultured Roseibium sp. TaxID=1936171 RepID=UPI0032162265
MAETDDGRRQGRGRLSSLEMLPEEADGDLLWLHDELRNGNQPQTAILKEFNARLADRGIGPISKGAFSRYSVRKAREWREYDERLRLSRSLVETMGTDGADKMTVAVAERLKMAVDAVLSEGNLGPKEIAALARANRAAIAAQKDAIEIRRSLEEEQRRKLEEVADAVAQVGAKAGISEETMAEINRRIVGGA